MLMAALVPHPLVEAVPAITLGIRVLWRLRAHTGRRVTDACGRASRNYGRGSSDVGRCPVRSLAPPYRGCAGEAGRLAAKAARSGGTQHPFLRLSGVSRQPFCHTARVIRRCKLGFRQYSFHPTRLALIPDAYMASACPDLFCTCYFPPLLSELQPLLAKVSAVGMIYRQQDHLLIVELLSSAVTAHH
jgi:hypothetical protein